MRPDGAYLITGGLGAIGREVARYLVARGAGHVVLLGRSAHADTGALADIEQLRDRSEIHVIRGDVADEPAMGAVFERIDAEIAPLRGIFHAAGLLDDGLLVAQTAARFAAVMAPKVRGSWILHRLSLSRPVEHFVLFSSVASIVGSPGQAGYAAANAFMNRLARFRRALGLPATSLCWGPWAKDGLAARADKDGRLEGRGFASIPANLGIRALDRALSADRAELTIMDFRPGAWRESFPASAALPFFSELPVAEAHADGVRNEQAAEILSRLNSATTPRERRERLEAFLRSEIGRVLRQAPERIDLRAPFGSLGLDSLMALEVRNRLERALGRSLPVSLVWNYPTVAELAVFLAGVLGLPLDADDPPAPGPAQDADDARTAELAAMSEDEVLELLGAKLRGLEGPGVSGGK
jgi:NAD(P)-dependent dehydrogenase (short-subunit alcohol dehydrogenase family)/acyl carrier protein